MENPFDHIRDVLNGIKSPPTPEELHDATKLEKERLRKEKNLKKESELDRTFKNLPDRKADKWWHN